MQKTRSEHAAFVLVRKANTSGRDLSLAELNKLMYFADKESLGVVGRSLSGARYRAVENGPVVVGLEELVRNSPAFRIEGDRLQTAGPTPGRLSRGDEAILNAVWAKHGARSLAEMSDFSHDSHEWRHRSGGILLENMLIDVGYREDAANAMATELRYNQRVHDARAMERRPGTDTNRKRTFPADRGRDSRERARRPRRNGTASGCLLRPGDEPVIVRTPASSSSRRPSAS